MEIEHVRASVADDDDLAPEVDSLITAAERVAAVAEGMVGQCERDRPFAEMFLVARGRRSARVAMRPRSGA